MEDLLTANRNQQVFLLPLGIQYFYTSAPWGKLAKLMAELEQDLGMPAVAEMAPVSHETATSVLYPRLVALGHHLLNLMETYYANFFKVTFDQKALPEGDESSIFAFRLNRLLDTALQVAESFFHLAPKGSLIDRCRKIEQAGWDWIYREDLRENTLSPVERGLADRIAEEADLRMWHMRLVENFVAVTGSYVAEKPTVERFAETLLLLRDTIVRIEGKNPFPRPSLGDQVARLSIGQPISVSDRWSAYQSNRRQAVANLTEDLQAAMQELIRS